MEKGKMDRLKSVILNELTDDQREELMIATGLKSHPSETLLGVIGDCANILSGSSSLESAMEVVFPKIGLAADVDRVYYFDVHEDPKGGDEPLCSQKIEWVRDQVEPVIDNPELQNMKLSQYKEFFNPLKSGKPFSILIREIEEPDLKELLESQQILSLLALPVMAGNHFRGLVGFDLCRYEKKWGKEEIAGLKIVTSQLGSLIEKEEMQGQMDDTYRQARIGTWKIDLQDGSHYWSPVLKEIFEVDPDVEPDPELASKLIRHRKDLENVQRVFRKAIEHGIPYQEEFEVITPKGNVKWIRDTGKVEYRNGKPVSLYGTVQDIDEKKRAVLKSEKSEKLLDAISNQTQVAIMVRDSDGRQLFVNREWRQIFGHNEINVLGKSLKELFPEEIAEKIRKKDLEVLESGKQKLYEERLETVSGTKYYMVNKFPITGIPGMENAIGGIGTDITDVKEAEKRLQETQQKLKHVVEHSTNLFYSHDSLHNMIYVSPQVEHYFGCNPQEAKKKWTEFIDDSPINKKGFEMTERAIQTGEQQPPYELQLTRTDGSKLWVEVNEAPMVEDGKTVLIIGSLTDITDRKRVEEEVRKSLREKETLLAEIHHRVKNNLAVVASMMQMKAHLTEDQSLEESLLDSVMRIKSMANIHEHLYKSQSFADVNFSENLKALVDDIIHTMQFCTSIDVIYHCEPVLLNVNRAIPCSLLVNEVITNILKHAFVGRKKGEIEISLTEKDSEIELIIRDNGVGFSEDFEPESTQSLGMQLIRTLTQQLSGTSSYSSADPGALFRLEFSRKGKPVLH
ncbi:MAG: PAS domain S-box protein [Balneolaceae bacterium]|nr:PAS domain S-box protein [Balneolaceae bacterium]MCH8548888.1 PAS domain S-box protein [Balneolaceae bacterium]